jgi:hypothetical protein
MDTALYGMKPRRLAGVGVALLGAAVIAAHLVASRDLDRAAAPMQAALADVAQLRAAWLPTPGGPLGAAPYAGVGDYVRRVNIDVAAKRDGAVRLADGARLTWWLNGRRRSVSADVLARIDAELAEAAAAREALDALEPVFQQVSAAERALADAQRAAEGVLTPASDVADFTRATQALDAAARAADAAAPAAIALESPRLGARAQDYFIALTTRLTQGLDARRAHAGAHRTAIVAARAALADHTSQSARVAAELAPALAAMQSAVSGVAPVLAAVRERAQPLSDLLRQAREPIRAGDAPAVVGTVLNAVNSLRAAPLTPADLIGQVSTEAGLAVTGLVGLVDAVDALHGEVETLRGTTSKSQTLVRAFLASKDRASLMRLGSEAPAAAEYFTARAGTFGTPVALGEKLRPQVRRLRAMAADIPSEMLAMFAGRLAAGADATIDRIEAPFVATQRDLLRSAEGLQRLAALERAYQSRIEELNRSAATSSAR